MSTQLDAARMLSTEALCQRYQDGFSIRDSLAHSLTLPHTRGKGDIYTALENHQEETLTYALVLKEREVPLPRRS